MVRGQAHACRIRIARRTSSVFSHRQPWALGIGSITIFLMVSRNQAIIADQGDKPAGNLGSLVVLQKMARLGKPRMGLAGRTGNVADQIILYLAPAEPPPPPASFPAQMVKNGRSKSSSPARASAFTPATSLINDGNVRMPAV